MKKQIALGLELFLERTNYRDARIGLLCNQASVNHKLEHAADLFKQAANLNLTALFGPQHGIRGDVQDNMIETAHAVDHKTNLPIYSLYSETREPTAEMLRDVDVLVCDLFDVGCRVYTFIYTVANCMRAAGALNKKIVVCDRPNPINGTTVEGNLLNSDYASFVGQFPIPMRHGLTTGELAQLFQTNFGIECDLEIVKIAGWERNLWHDETDAPWVLPSPNMPTLETATVFPGTVLFEGTELSEGRGTTRPFEIVGAPFINADDFARELNALGLPGVQFRATSFMPTFQKHRQQACGGVQLHVFDRREFKSFLTGVALVKTAFEMYPKEFEWKRAAYEYVYDKNPFDVINGGETIRNWIEQRLSISEIEKRLQTQEDSFRELRKSCILY